MPDASPVKWHLAHTTWFFETFIVAPCDWTYRTLDPSYRVLFNSYYVAVGAQHTRTHMTIALPGATTASTGLPDNPKQGGVWIMNAGTTTAHLMTPGE